VGGGCELDSGVTGKAQGLLKDWGGVIKKYIRIRKKKKKKKKKKQWVLQLEGSILVRGGEGS